MSYSPPPAGTAEGAAPATAGRWLPRLSWQERLVLAPAGAMLLVLLATAAWLTPSPQGIGTHRQLGLPPCTIVSWYGLRCPSCGMTTSWSHLVRGRLPSAWRANAGGVLLGLAAMFTGPWLLASSLQGRWLGIAPNPNVILSVGLAIVTVTLIDWTLRLSLGW